MGAILRRHFAAREDQVIVLSRTGETRWDGQTLGPWAEHLEGADVVINLAGRTVNCRYTVENLRQMMDSRVDSTRVIGQAIAQAKNPSKVWLQSSTATIYSHRLDAPNDELTGIIGGDEPGVPSKWVASTEIAKAWEQALWDAKTPGTRKVAMRSAMTMSPDPGSVFDVLARLAKRGLGGTLGNGRQYVSWIHELDFANAVQFLIDREGLDGAMNLCSPNPLPQRDFARVLRQAVGVRFGLRAPGLMVEIGTRAMRTESELVLKSRRAVPTRLLQAGFTFRFPTWQDASSYLTSQSPRGC